MKRAFVPILAVLSSIATPALSEPTNAITAPGKAPAVPPISAPTAIGRPHLCLPYYPDEAVQKHIEGLTKVKFVIGEDGTVRNATILQSSGSTLLDEASLTCVKTWQYKPAAENGKAIAVPWRAEVRWILSGMAEGPADGASLPSDTLWQSPVPDPPGTIHDCSGYYPPGAGRMGIQGSTKLRFSITAEGVVTDVTVDTSAGTESLDKAAIACVKTWRYRPAKRNGQPIPVPWRTIVKWVHPNPIPPQPTIDPPTTTGAPHICSNPQKGATGKTELWLQISAQGKVTRVRVITPSGNPALDDAAVACVGGWVYGPATQSGTPVAVSWSEVIDWGHAPAK